MYIIGIVQGWTISSSSGLCGPLDSTVWHTGQVRIWLIQSSGGRGLGKGSYAYAYNDFLVIIFFQEASELCAFEGNKGDVILTVFLGPASFRGRLVHICFLPENTSVLYYFLHILHGIVLFLSHGIIIIAV